MRGPSAPYLTQLDRLGEQFSSWFMALQECELDSYNLFDKGAVCTAPIKVSLELEAMLANTIVWLR